jgi:hypothetical protein
MRFYRDDGPLGTYEACAEKCQIPDVRAHVNVFVSWTKNLPQDGFIVVGIVELTQSVAERALGKNFSLYCGSLIVKPVQRPVFQRTRERRNRIGRGSRLSL